MTRKRLAVILPYITSEGGGVTEAVRVLVAGLAATGVYNIDVLSFAGQNENEAHKSWPKVRFFSFPTYGPKSYCFCPGLVTHMLRYRYDVIHLHGIWMFHVFAARIGQMRKTATLISPHGMLEPWILKRRVALKRAVSRLYQDRTFKKANVIHALTTKEAEDIRATYPNAFIKIIPNFVPQTAMTNEQPSWWRPQMHGRKTFLFLARIHDKKGWRELLRAWRSLMTLEPDLEENTQLIFCGWQDDVPDFESEIAVASAEFGNVHYAGPQYGRDKQACYEVADVFVLPSFSEGLPMTVLEAVQSGTLVAMSRECNMPELFDGMAIETGTRADTIQKALQTCIDMNVPEIEERQTRARIFVDRHMSEAAVVGQFSSIYAALGEPTSSASDILESTSGNSIFTGAPSFSLMNRVVRAVWAITWLLFASWTPPPLHKWRILLLKLFGANIDWSCKVYGSTKIWLPKNLTMAPSSVMGPRVICYNQGPVTIGQRAIVSQNAHLCTGTHDITSPTFQLRTRPISLGPQCWICADAFVGPGVSVGAGTVLAARAVAFKNLESWTVHGGNPAKFIKQRPVLPFE